MNLAPAEAQSAGAATKARHDIGPPIGYDGLSNEPRAAALLSPPLARG
jgi:hypothetical protein